MGEKLSRRLSRAISILAAGVLFVGLPVYGQVEIQDGGFPENPPDAPYYFPGGYEAPYRAVEPLDSTPMECDPFGVMRGAGVEVMYFEVRDVDPPSNDDMGPPTILGITVENLGTATDQDVVEVLVYDATATGNCDPSALVTLGGPQPTTPSADRNIGFIAQWDTNYTIPDDGTVGFWVAVRVNETDQLLNRAQGHTLRLRVTLEIEEQSGSPPFPHTYTASVTDGKPEFVWNGGVNSFTEDFVLIDPLMPGEIREVGRFTLCDRDSNDDALHISLFNVKQGPSGTAIYTDIAGLRFYRIEGAGRSLIASLTSADIGVEFNRGGAGIDVPLSLQLNDDQCVTVAVEAEISAFALKGKTLQLQIQVLAEEPFGWPVNPTAAPVVLMDPPVAIGRGLLDITNPSPFLIRDRGTLEIRAVGFPLPGFGALEGTLTYDPNVIHVKGIIGVAVDAAGLNPVPVTDTTDPDVTTGDLPTGYQILYRVVECDDALVNGDAQPDACVIDNRRGEARFSVWVDPAMRDFAFQHGPVAYVIIERAPGAVPNQRTLVSLTFETVTDADNVDLTMDVGMDPGEVRLATPGDVDLDGRVTVSDALLLADQLLRDCVGLTDEQKMIADVADPVAPEGAVPMCNTELTSADVAEIARLALGVSSSSASAEPQAPVRAFGVSAVQAFAAKGALTVKAQGVGIQGVRVQLFDLAGRTVLDEGASGRQLRVRLLDEQGRPLANGVYLYVVEVKGVDGRVIRTDVRKLVVLR